MNRIIAHRTATSNSGLRAHKPAVCCAQARHERTAEASAATLSPIASVSSSAFLWLLTSAPALAEAEKLDFSQGGNADPKSYYTVLGLFLLSLPGLWSQIKRSPKAKIKRKVFEVPGPKKEDAMPIDDRARQIFRYFKSYNYEVKSTGEVIAFVGNYRSTRGQAAAITFYTFCGMLCTGLVLSIAAPFGGEKWYLLTLLTPLSTWYYFKNADRQEEFNIKMVTADDEMTTDIIVQGDEEEINRMSKELQLMEKGMVYVPGILEGAQQEQEK